MRYSHGWPPCRQPGWALLRAHISLREGQAAWKTSPSCERNADERATLVASWWKKKQHRGVHKRGDKQALVGDSTPASPPSFSSPALASHRPHQRPSACLFAKAASVRNVPSINLLTRWVIYLTLIWVTRCRPFCVAPSGMRKLWFCRWRWHRLSLLHSALHIMIPAHTTANSRNDCVETHQALSLMTGWNSSPTLYPSTALRWHH